MVKQESWFDRDAIKILHESMHNRIKHIQAMFVAIVLIGATGVLRAEERRDLVINEDAAADATDEHDAFFAQFDA